MKKWPKDKTKAVFLESLLKPVKDAIGRVRNGKEANYRGYETPSTNYISPDPEEMFNAEGLEYHRERGRDETDVGLLVAFRLGYEQAKREFSIKNELLEEALQVLERQICEMKS